MRQGSFVKECLGCLEKNKWEKHMEMTQIRQLSIDHSSRSIYLLVVIWFFVKKSGSVLHSLEKVCQAP